MPTASSSGNSSGCTGLSGAGVARARRQPWRALPGFASRACRSASAASRAISTCAATDAAIAAGALSRIVVSADRADELADPSAAMPIFCIARREARALGRAADQPDIGKAARLQRRDRRDRGRARGCGSSRRRRRRRGARRSSSIGIALRDGRDIRRKCLRESRRAAHRSRSRGTAAARAPRVSARPTWPAPNR